MKNLYLLIGLILTFSPLLLHAQWTEQNEITPRHLLAAGSTENIVFFVGGNQGGFLPNNEMDIYYVDEDRWEKIELSNRRAGMSVSVWENVAYISGGVSFSNAMESNAVDIVNLSTLEVSQEQLSLPRVFHSSLAYDNKIYFAGGGDFEGGKLENISDLVEVFDVSNASWSTMNLSEPRLWMGAAAGDGKLYFIGGANDENIASDVIDIYDVASETWTTEKLSIPRIDPAVFSYKGKLYVAVGLNESNSHFASVEIFDAATGEWTIENLVTPRAGIEIVTACDKIYFVGGGRINWSSLMITDATTTVDVYDTITDEWSTNNLPSGNYGSGVAAADNKIFVAGGFSPSSFFNNQVRQLICEESPNNINDPTQAEATVGPNPVMQGDHVFVKGSNLQGFELFDAIGSLIRKNKQSSSTDFSFHADLTKGIYFCKVMFENNFTKTYKIIVQ